MSSSPKCVSVFFDLETSDLEPVGQILNFAFVAVDEQFKVIDQCADLVRISRLQLPRAQAILANRTNVKEHQIKAKLSEYQAVQRIDAFLSGIAQQFPDAKLSLIGFNSSEFDLGFLRTVFIRNAHNPYWSRYVNRDLLLVARELLATNDNFREVFFRADSDEKLSLKLERLCRIFGLLDGEQLHESLFDVNLTVRLAQVFLERFGIDVRSFEPYRVKKLHSLPAGAKVLLGEPVKRNYSTDRRVESFEAVLIDANERNVLWANVQRYEELKQAGEPLRKAIRWMKTTDALLQQLAAPTFDDPLATEIKSAFVGLSLKNYFEPPECYLEQHIYRFNINKLELLKQALRTGQLVGERDPDLITLFRRFQIENAPLVMNTDLASTFVRYAKHRYNGEMLLSKSKEQGEFHPTYSKMLAEIGELRVGATPQQVALLDALEDFYAKSDICRVISTEAIAA